MENTRIKFDLSKFAEVKKIVEKSGGKKEDFITDECLELGEDEDYKSEVIDIMKKLAIEFSFVE